jgi:hypothetical protein
LNTTFQSLDNELRNLADGELVEKLEQLEMLLGQDKSGLVLREPIIGRIKTINCEGKSVPQLKEILRNRLAAGATWMSYDLCLTLQSLTLLFFIIIEADDLTKSIDYKGCIALLGMTWCGSKQLCVQNWKGGIDGPCIEGSICPWKEMNRVSLEALLKSIFLTHLNRMTTTEIKERVLQLDPALLPLEQIETKSKPIKPIVVAVTTCPIHSHDFPTCTCDKGYQGKINVRLAQGSCKKAQCPAFSSNHPDCTCIAGHHGTIHWNADIMQFNGACEPCGKVNFEFIMSNIKAEGYKS